MSPYHRAYRLMRKIRRRLHARPDCPDTIHAYSQALMLVCHFRVAHFGIDDAPKA